MNRRTALILGTVAVWGMCASAGLATPEASIASTEWQLDLEFHDPQRISLTLPGDSAPTTFWYVLYQVTNNTGQDVEFYPSFRLVTDTLHLVRGGDNISPSVYDAIIGQHEREYPFMARPTKITGPLLQGEENARASVAVFRMFDKESNRFTLYVSGLSAELTRVGNPSFDPDKKESEANPRFFILRRTLAVTYDLPGDAVTRSGAEPIRRTRGWVMR